MNTDRWSFRVEIKKPAIMGMSEFSVMNPMTRGHLWEWLVLKAARMIREDFLLQNAFHDTDAYTGIMKQFRMLLAVIHMFRRLEAALKEGADIEVFENMDSEERIAKLRFLSEDDAGLDEIRAAVDREIESITRGTE